MHLRHFKAANNYQIGTNQRESSEFNQALLCFQLSLETLKELRNIRLLPFGSAFCDSTTIYNKASWQELTSTILSEATELEVAKVRFLSKLPFFAFIGSWRWRSDRVYNSATAIHDRTCDIINSVDLLPLRRWNELLDLLVQPLKSRFNMAYYRDITSPERRQSWYRPKQSNHVKLFVM